jgi:NAD(P)-dependent dehydrogenase (short-subunit alcohol dehydrogenase family)
MAGTLEGKVALVAGATRGAGRGIATSLGEAGATVWCTGRSTRADAQRQAAPRENPFELARRPETIEETAELVSARGGRGIALRVDHTDETQVKDLIDRIDKAHGRLDILVNDIWGGDELAETAPFWELTPGKGYAMVDTVLRTHINTTRFALPLMLKHRAGLVAEITDGNFLGYRGTVFYDLAKIIPIRLTLALKADLTMRGERGIAAVTLTPGFLRSEAVLEYFGVTEQNWRDAIAKDPYFAESETPCYVGRAVAALAADPNVAGKSGRLFASWELAKEYGFSDIDGRQPDWATFFDKKVAEIIARGGPGAVEERALIFARYFQLALDPAKRELTNRMAASLGLPPSDASLA